jgi:hypothetical protein
LDYLQKQNLIPGARIKVQEVVEYTGVVTFKKGDKTLIIDLDTLEQTIVESATPQP